MQQPHGDCTESTRSGLRMIAAFKQCDTEILEEAWVVVRQTATATLPKVRRFPCNHVMRESKKMRQ